MTPCGCFDTRVRTSSTFCSSCEGCIDTSSKVSGLKQDKAHIGSLWRICSAQPNMLSAHATDTNEQLLLEMAMTRQTNWDTACIVAAKHICDHLRCLCISTWHTAKAVSHMFTKKRGAQHLHMPNLCQQSQRVGQIVQCLLPLCCVMAIIHSLCTHIAHQG